MFTEVHKMSHRDILAQVGGNRPLDSTGTFGRKLPSTSVLVDDDAMAHPMEAEYVMIESFRDAQPDVEDVATVSSPGIESLDQAAEAASTALRHAEAEGARGLAVFGQPVLVSELDAQEQIRELERHLQELKVQIANQEDADMGVDLLGLDDPADGGAGNPPSAPGASGPAAGRVASAVAPTSSATTPSAAEAQPALLTTMAEPPVAWPVSVEPRAAAPTEQMEDDHSERAGLGFTPPAPAGYSVDPVDAMATTSSPSTPPAKAQAPGPPRPSKRPAPQPMEEPTSKTPTLPGFTRASEPTLKKRMLEESSGSAEASLQAAVTTMEKAKAANKQIQDQGTAFMEKFALNPVEILAWPTDLKHKLWRGASSVRRPHWTGTRSRTPRTCCSTTFRPCGHCKMARTHGLSAPSLWRRCPTSSTQWLPRHLGRLQLLVPLAQR